jgi:hypothetical protein
MRVIDKYELMNYGYEVETDKTLNVITEAEFEEIEKEQNQSLTLIEHIDRIVRVHSFLQRRCEDTEKKIKCQKILDRHLKICSDILEINAAQMLIFSFILNKNMSQIENLAAILQVTRIQCLKHLDDLDVLLKKRLIKRRGNEGNESYAYWIPFEVINSLREGKPFSGPHFYNLSKKNFLII